MDQFNIGNFGKRFNNYPPQNMNREGGPINSSNPEAPFPTPPPVNPGMIARNSFQVQMMNSNAMFNNLKMNVMASFDRGLYIKDLMNMPKDIEEVLVLIQNETATEQQATKLLNTKVSLSTLAELIQAGGKEAMNKLVLVMANSAKQGITDLSQIKDAIKLINASVSVASQDNPNQVLKSFMLLYLPWLPLQEGVDFDLEIAGSDSGGEEGETSITILISTRNFGNVKVTLILVAGNSVSIIVNCSEKFPKEELLKRINAESKNHSMQSNITFEQKDFKYEPSEKRQAKISMSNLTEVNPFLLLMANAVIRHTIELDNQAG